MGKRMVLMLYGILWITLLNGQNSIDPAQQRKITLTFDDLPLVSLLNTPEQRQVMTNKLVTTLTDNNVPAIGFVNEMQLYSGGNRDTTQIGLLKQWIEAGLALGNHTYGHPSLHRIDTVQYFQEIVKGQQITNELLLEKKDKVKFFRHPYLHTGNSLEKKRALEAFLLKKSLKVAPVTVDNADWHFSRAYDNALLSGDSSLMAEIGKAYIAYMEKCVAYYESQSLQLLDYEISQILLLHANSINADYLDELLVMLQHRGYAFIPLEEALEDKAYQTMENYVGEGGISWLHRWALFEGKTGEFFKGEPEIPAFVINSAALD